MSNQLERFFDNAELYTEKEKAENLDTKYNKRVLNILSNTSEIYISYMLTSLKEAGAIENIENPIINFKVIENESFFDNKDTLGIMVNNLNNEDNKINESLFFFIDLSAEPAKLLTIDYSLYSDDDFVFNVFKISEPNVPLNSVIKKIMEAKKMVLDN